MRGEESVADLKGEKSRADQRERSDVLGEFFCKSVLHQSRCIKSGRVMQKKELRSHLSPDLRLRSCHITASQESPSVGC